MSKKAKRLRRRTLEMEERLLAIKGSQVRAVARCNSAKSILAEYKALLAEVYVDLNRWRKIQIGLGAAPRMYQIKFLVTSSAHELNDPADIIDKAAESLRMYLAQFFAERTVAMLESRR